MSVYALDVSHTTPQLPTESEVVADGVRNSHSSTTTVAKCEVDGAALGFEKYEQLQILSFAGPRRP